MNELFKLTYSFDLLKQAIETLAKNMDSRDANLSDFLKNLEGKFKADGDQIRIDYKNDLEALRKEMGDKFGHLLNLNLDDKPKMSTPPAAFDASDLVEKLQKLREEVDVHEDRLNSIDNKLLVLQPASSNGEGIDMTALE